MKSAGRIQRRDHERKRPTKKTLIIGLSGPSSSGKTTLARLLRTIFNVTVSVLSSPASANYTDGTDAESRKRGTMCKKTMKMFLVHEDDFYKTDAEIPIITTPSGRQLQDWDCAESLDMPLFESTLRHIHEHGSLPPEMFSKEDQNAVGESGVSDSDMQKLKEQVSDWLAGFQIQQPATDNGTPDDDEIKAQEVTLCILDGFLLYSNPADPSIPSSVLDLLDLKLFIRSNRERTKRRREARKGYVTLEGFWEDPEGYVDEVVWPNYVREHKWMFENGNVDQGDLVREVQQVGILVGPGKGEKDLQTLLEWAVTIIQDQIQSLEHRIE